MRSAKRNRVTVSKENRPGIFKRLRYELSRSMEICTLFGLQLLRLPDGQRFASAASAYKLVQCHAGWLRHKNEHTREVSARFPML